MNMIPQTDPDKTSDWDKFMSTTYEQNVALIDRVKPINLDGRMRTICEQLTPLDVQVPPIFWELLIQIQGDWWGVLVHEFAKQDFIDLCWFLNAEYLTKQIYPRPDVILRALQLTPFHQVKCVILGQDPYHNGMATGLAFAQSSYKMNSSLGKIFKLIEKYQDFQRPPTGDLLGWAQQGVLLLNTVLTVESGKANSHEGKGWEAITDAIIKALSARQNVVFILMGGYAQQKGTIIDQTNNLVIETVHPVAHGQFLKSPDIFLQCNEYLVSCNKEIINWTLCNLIM